MNAPATCPACGGGPPVGHGCRDVPLPAIEDGRLRRVVVAVRRYRCRRCGIVCEPDPRPEAARAAAREFAAVTAFRDGIPAAAEAAGVNVKTCGKWIGQWLDRTRTGIATPKDLGLLSSPGGLATVLFDAATGLVLDADAGSRLPDMLSRLDRREVETVHVDFDRAALAHAEAAFPLTRRAVAAAAATRRLDALLKQLRAAYICREVDKLRDDVRAGGWTANALRWLYHHIVVCGDGMRRQRVFIEMWRPEIVAGFGARTAWPGPELDLSGIPASGLALAAAICRNGLAGPPGLATLSGMLDGMRRRAEADAAAVRPSLLPSPMPSADHPGGHATPRTDRPVRPA